MVTSMESIWSSWMRRMWNAGNCAFCGLPLQHEYFKKEIYSSLPQNTTNWRSRWIKACNIGKKGCWFLLILSLLGTKTQVCPIGLLVKTPLGWIRSFDANPNYVVITRFSVHYFLKNSIIFNFLDINVVILGYIIFPTSKSHPWIWNKCNLWSFRG